MSKRGIRMLCFLLALSACNLPGSGGQNNDPYAVVAEAPVQDGGASDPRMGLQNPTEEPGEAEPAVPSGPGASLIFFNGTILTMNDAQPTAEALAVQGNTILAVGDQETILTLQGENTRMVDLDGRTLMPGFIDAHSHIVSTTLGYYEISSGDGQFAANFAEFQYQILAEGITTLADMGGDHGEVVGQLRQMEADGSLHLRLSLYQLRITNCGEDFGAWYADIPVNLDPNELVQVPGVKVFTDGGSCNAPAMTVEYPAGGLGDLYFTQEELNQLVAEAQANGYQVAIHALGDRAIEQALAAIRANQVDGGNLMRHRIEHNATVRPDMFAQYSESKPVALVFGHFPACFWNGDTSQFKYVLPDAYRAWEWPYRSLIEANPDVMFAWHEDVPIFPMGAIDQLWSFTTRRELGPDGTVCEPPEWAQEQVIPIETALKLMTINAAYALLREEQIGSLEEGKLADMIVLSGNPLEIPAENLIDLEVQATLLNGETVFCADESLNICP